MSEPSPLSETKEDDQTNIDLYTSLIEQHGDSVRSVNWGSERSQQQRYEVLCGIGSLRGAKILDLGCGLGQMFDWLKFRQVETEYTGIDFTPSMVARALARNPGARFLEGTIFDIQRAGEKFDYVLASGLFYRRKHAPFEYMRMTVEAMFDVCTKGAAFNTLSRLADRKIEGDFHADPLETLAFCQRLTPFAVLRHDYHPGDFSVYLYRSKTE